MNRKTFYLACIVFLQWFIICISLIFVLGVSRVEAAQIRYLNNATSGAGSWQNPGMGTLYTNDPVAFNTTGKTMWQFRDTTAFSGNNVYDLKLNFDFYVYTYSGTLSKPTDALGSVIFEVYNGTTLVDISNKCTLNVTQINDYPNNLSATYRMLGTLSCTAVGGSSLSGYYPYFSFSGRQGGGQPFLPGKSTLRILSWSYTRNTAESSTNAIINSQTDNAQSIINNDNRNTEIINNNITNVGSDIVDATNGVTDALTSTDTPTIQMPTAPNFTFTGIEGIFLLPITIARSYQDTCSPYTFTIKGKSITFPCINLENYLGSTLWGIIDGLFAFSISIGLISLIRRVYIDFSNLSDNVYFEYYGTPETYGDYQDYVRRHGGASE